jgi:hypothetical protein
MNTDKVDTMENEKYNVPSRFAGHLAGQIVARQWMPYRPIFDEFSGHRLEVRYSDEDERLEKEADERYSEVRERYYNEIMENRDEGEKRWQAEFRVYNHPEVNAEWNVYQTVRRGNVKKYFPHTVECKLHSPSPYGMDIDIPSFIRGIDEHLWDTDVSCYKVKEVKHIADYCWYFSVIIELDKNYLE